MSAPGAHRAAARRRRLRSALGGCLLLLGACATTDAPAPAAPPLVAAGGEWLAGSYGEQGNDVRVYKGVPYAMPPTGARRWAAPVPHAPRPGRQDATRYAAGCYQNSYNNDWYRRVGDAFGADPAGFRDPPFSEDCLYLNVWAPAAAAGERLPVIVWIHGGANFGGWSFESNYRGETLARRGRVVVVSIAYRLGIFGFFSHPELRAAAAPANFALLDQIAALRWVRDYISAFGGDPGNVTVAGESAGGADIGYLLASPAAGDLFRRAISQSGGYLMRDAAGLTEAESTGAAVARAAGSHTLAELRAQPAAVVFAAAQRALPDHDYHPVIDGHVLVEAPARAFRQHGIRHDLLVGSNDHEYYMYSDEDPLALARSLAALPPAARAPLAELAVAEPSVRHGLDRINAFADMACPTYLMAASVTGPGARAWVYRFARVRPGAGGQALLAYHGAEIPYVFDTHDPWLSGDAADAALSTAMIGYWTRFARSGDPNASGAAVWPAWTDAQPQLMRLDAHSAPIEPPLYGLCLRLAGDLYPGWAP